MTATVDFYGHDLLNNKVTATGYLTIFFANYADQASEEAHQCTPRNFLSSPRPWSSSWA